MYMYALYYGAETRRAYKEEGSTMCASVRVCVRGHGAESYYALTESSSTFAPASLSLDPFLLCTSLLG